MRPVARKNKDGGVSTVKFQQMDDFVYPTIFPKDPDNPTSDPKDWITLDGEDALIEAQKRGEVLRFSSEREAREFAKSEKGGDWKSFE